MPAVGQFSEPTRRHEPAEVDFCCLLVQVAELTSESVEPPLAAAHDPVRAHLRNVLAGNLRLGFQGTESIEASECVSAQMGRPVSRTRLNLVEALVDRLVR